MLHLQPRQFVRHRLAQVIDQRGILQLIRGRLQGQHQRKSLLLNHQVEPGFNQQQHHLTLLGI